MSVHLSIGQEAEIVGACMALTTEDYIVGNHRSHGHPIGKGAGLRRLMAELLGKATGVNQGKGGSMHLADFSVGSVGETSIVGSGIPVAAGAALGAQLTIFNCGGYGSGDGGPAAVCQRHEVFRWWRAGCSRAGPPGTGAAGGRGVNRGGGQ